MRSSFCLLAVLPLMLISATSPAPAEEPVKLSTRLDYLLEQADQLHLTVPDAPEPPELERVAEPILKYSNPLYEGQSDGILVMWKSDNVPAVMASFSIRKNKILFAECVTLADGPLLCQRGNGVFWKPQPGFEKRTLGDLPEPDDNQRFRLSMMKRIAKRASREGLRLMPTPLHRYASAKRGIIDGALFSMTSSTDPEIFVVVEAIAKTDSKPSHWRYGVYRMNSNPQEVKFDGDVVVTYTGYWKSPQAKNDPYIERWMGQIPEELRSVQ